jgi:hypothetical protein
MGNLHKLFKEMQNLNYEDFDLLCDAWREHHNVKRNCENMGIKYSDKILAKYITNITASRVTSQPTSAPPTNNNYKKIEKIILGDNLDIIEEAAKKKGLV